MQQITVNGQTRDLSASHTVSDLLNELELTGKRIAVERNGQIVPKSEHARTTLNSGDSLEIVVAVGGG